MEDFLQPNTNALGILDVMAENTLKKGHQFPYDGIWAFSGSQGSGKTLLMMHLVRQMHEDFPDSMIISNISIFGMPCIPFTGTDDFEKYTNGDKGIIFVIDEIDKLYNSLESKNIPLSSMQIWSQNRKNRRVICGTSQRFTRCAKGLREQAKYNYECRMPLLNVIYSYRVFDGSDYDDNGKYLGEEPKRHFYVPSVSTMRMYNTLEVVKRNDFNT